MMGMTGLVYYSVSSIVTFKMIMFLPIDCS